MHQIVKIIRIRTWPPVICNVSDPLVARVAAFPVASVAIGGGAISTGCMTSKTRSSVRRRTVSPTAPLITKMRTFRICMNGWLLVQSAKKATTGPRLASTARFTEIAIINNRSVAVNLNFEFASAENT